MSDLDQAPRPAASSDWSTIELKTLTLEASLQQQLIYARDLARAFAELEAKEAQRKRLLEKVISAQEDERRRIAIDIHDEVLQMLGFNLMKIDLIERLWQKGDYPLALEHLRTLRDTLESAINLLRDIITDLRPPSLDVQGLIPTLDEYLKRFRRETGIEVALSSAIGRRQSPTVETLIYRLVQEALVNTRKHAKATRVSVDLVAQGDRIQVTVQDNGRGFVVEEALRDSLARGSIGLHSIIERVHLAGGECEILSEPGAGTTIRFSVPMNA
ncbi:MAG: sensor histidine kinase [Chloroflexota bacterium]|nr:sensor histidine kinase [Dehalococcoidia bacterium]MDW8254096.1 sensor histidine kinase [Chloroflexota bacterium]